MNEDYHARPHRENDSCSALADDILLRYHSSTPKPVTDTTSFGTPHNREGSTSPAGNALSVNIGSAFRKMSGEEPNHKRIRSTLDEDIKEAPIRSRANDPCDKLITSAFDQIMKGYEKIQNNHGATYPNNQYLSLSTLSKQQWTLYGQRLAGGKQKECFFHHFTELAQSESSPASWFASYMVGCLAIAQGKSSSQQSTIKRWVAAAKIINEIIRTLFVTWKADAYSVLYALNSEMFLEKLPARADVDRRQLCVQRSCAFVYRAS